MPYFYLVISGILFGGVVFGAKVLSNMGASLFEIVIYSSFLVVLTMFWPSRHDLHKIFSLPWKITLVLVVAMVLTNGGQYAPLFFQVPVTVVVLLLYLQPVWTALIERFYFRRPTDVLEWFALLAMIFGLVVLINPSGGAHLSGWGVFMALLGGIGLSLWILVTQNLSQRGISAWGNFWSCYFYTLIPFLVIYALLQNFFPASPDLSLRWELPPKMWLAFLGYVLLILTLPDILLYKNNRNISATVIGMILLLEPVSAIIMDVLFLGQKLSLNIIIGGLIILGANIVLIFHSRCQGRCWASKNKRLSQIKKLPQKGE